MGGFSRRLASGSDMGHLLSPLVGYRSRDSRYETPHTVDRVSLGLAEHARPPRLHGETMVVVAGRFGALGRRCAAAAGARQ